MMIIIIIIIIITVTITDTNMSIISTNINMNTNIGRTLEAPIPKMSGLVGTNDLFSKAFICPPCFRAPLVLNTRAITINSYYY